MNRAAYDELRELEDAHWWFRGRRAAIAKHVDWGLGRVGDAAILDVGCGTGANLAFLARRTDSTRLIGLDPEAHALELARERGLALQLVRADAAHLPIATGRAAMIVCCDVLEHLDDDAAACRELARVLRPGGTLVVTVPAGPGLWSVHDQALGHRRRYARGELEERLRAAGFDLEACHGFNLALSPLVWLVRRWRRNSRANAASAAPTTDFTSLPRPINAALAAWLAIESRCCRAFGLRAGVSLVVRARRR